jgi:hypothetical protein
MAHNLKYFTLLLASWSNRSAFKRKKRTSNRFRVQKRIVWVGATILIDQSKAKII